MPNVPRSKPAGHHLKSAPLLDNQSILVGVFFLSSLFHAPLKRRSHDRKRHPGWQLVVGQPFVDGVISSPDERFEYRIFGGHDMLRICMASLAERDVPAFHQGQVTLGICKLNSVLFVFFRVAGFMDWSDQAYSHHLVTHPEDRELPPQVPCTQHVLLLVLVESETGLVRGLRVVTWSRHGSVVFDPLLREQLESPFDAIAHAHSIQNVYIRYPRSKDLRRAALLAERAGANL